MRKLLSNKAIIFLILTGISLFLSNLSDNVSEIMYKVESKSMLDILLLSMVSAGRYFFMLCTIVSAILTIIYVISDTIED